jgi:hypothetical protein
MDSSNGMATGSTVTNRAHNLRPLLAESSHWTAIPLSGRFREKQTLRNQKSESQRRVAALPPIPDARVLEFQHY